MGDLRRLEYPAGMGFREKGSNKKNTVFLVGDGHKRNRWYFLRD